MKEEVIQFLRHIGDDVVPDGVVAWPECEGQGDDKDSCADHEDCGLCRFEYMKKQGWLSPEITTTAEVKDD